MVEEGGQNILQDVVYLSESSFYLVGLDSCGVVMKRFPLVRVPVPVEPSSLDVHVEVRGQLFHDPGERWTVLKNDDK